MVRGQRMGAFVAPAFTMCTSNGSPMAWESGNGIELGGRWSKSNTDISDLHRLGIELTKILVLQSSNQETSVTIGESVRDEDGTLPLLPFESRPTHTDVA